MPPRKVDWLKLFEDFVGDIRIASKEALTDDPRGAPLLLWESQRRFLREVGSGLNEGIHKFNCLKSRQLGVTTISLAIDVFWLAMHKNMIGCLVSDTEKNRDANRRLIEHYVASFPEGYFGDDFHITISNRSMLMFSNGCRLDLLVAGVKKKSTAWGEGVGYSFAHLTEVAAYADPEGLKSLEEGFAQQNPHRLFLFESTAKGMNHWRERYLSGLEDRHTQRSFFVGWWAGDTNVIPRTDRRFGTFGTYPMNTEEKQLCRAVLKEHDYKITEEQLAWIRWKDHQAGSEQDIHRQNQPWTAEQAFVQTGYSFFQTRMIGHDMKRILDGNRENREYAYKAYRYSVDGDFYSFSMDRLEPDESSKHLVELKVWDEPVANGKYVIGFDPAYGRNDHKDGHCADQDTEILTSKGWRRYTEIREGDVAVCFDGETEQYVHGAISRVIVRDYDGDMVHFNTRGMDCLVTPEHRVISRNYRALRDGRKQTWRAYQAKDVADAGRSIREIPAGGAPVGAGIEGLSLDMCRAIGWIYTDGHTHKTGVTDRSRHRIVLAQATGTRKGGVLVADVMQDVMLRLCPNVTIRNYGGNSERGPWRMFNVGVKDAEVFDPYMTAESTRLPRYLIENASPEQIEALFLGICEGDGSFDEARGQWRRISPGLDEGFADDIQELALKIGYSVTKTKQKAAKEGEHDQWLLHLSATRTHTFQTTSVNYVNYTGKVWCVTVPTGAFVARRNGQVFVTGNCLSVWRCYADRMVQVAEYLTSDVETKHASWVLFHLQAAYGDCMSNVELGGPGRLVMAEIEHLRQLVGAEHNREKTQSREWEDAGAQARWFLYHKVDSPGAGYVANFETTWRTKMELMHGMRGAYVSREIIVKSMHLLKEMQNVVVVDDKIGAPESSDVDMKDDRVFACALAVRAWQDWIRKEMVAQGLTYERVQEQDDNRESPPKVRNIMNQVYRFLAPRDEVEESRGPDWMVRRGLR